ncbi:DUF4019 domain-containing protein [Luteimonas sp. BDR2-5]|uniref:DUF4019 domain-containing protein n=1 Tax=Proluteimonas luteida TaxID=2878685 RepID=UPI001E5A8FF0|nr:DUF4019 domain-containing protein [Luteimonas sp. BDR2-5]MCD9028284.1 DUF4019 domain-containing protein [Luteimonas sp. BDR2-5]
MNTLRLAVSAVLLASCAAVAAQQPQPQPAPQQDAAAQPELTPEQRAQIARQDAEMSQAALQVMQMIDANQIGEVWDGASDVMKQSVPREEFVRQISADRTRLGAPTQRSQPTVSRSQFPAGAEVPEGIYINIASPTTFANQEAPVRELVSFRFDSDRTWRVSGYSVR